MTYHEVVGREVRDVNGRLVGKVADLRAEDVSGKLRVTGLLVGEREWLSRLGIEFAGMFGRATLSGYFIAWPFVARIDRMILLNVPIESLNRMQAISKQAMKS